MTTGEPHGTAPDPAADQHAGPPTASGPWTLWTVLRRPATPATPGPGPSLATAVAEPGEGVVVRGFYDVSGLRADADVMVWIHGDSAEALQAEQRRLRRTAELSPLVPAWAAMGVHRPAEFSRDHEPAYMRDKAPLPWLTVYPFVRSYEWYLLPADERRAMLGEHGRKGREFPEVLSNTVASFSLGDYEWILALEADELVELVDLMRRLRDTEARRHVREEIPFFTGRRIEADEVAEVLL
ncbi:hydrogen peroxide-dependent heme synthase [Actinotalea sp. Marseille-Q4924]|uniref:hydrogen peroxide-dependent heme synthase n=1 Tax=Actinotalea sp. Marseille-Q4924 TaxID=2866571 RepID=UPI001CE49780|nr:hydrogen peroxide-dependent heme synthase [Actinotalea sp. Marseille-Q4924]